MYKVAEEEINKGLSPTARFILGFFSGAFGVFMIVIAPTAERPIYAYAFGVFCLIICLAAVTKGRVRQFMGSIIGCTLFALSGLYLYAQITEGQVDSGSRSEPSVINAVCFLVFFGIPGIAYAIKAKFGMKRDKTKQDS